MAVNGQNMAQDQIPFETLLRKNDLGIIENPLRRIARPDLIEHIRKFHEENYLQDVVDVDILIKGGLLARDEDGFRIEYDLSEPQLKALDREKTSTIWEESKELKTILLTCFVASIVQGWAQGVLVGANQSWPDEFKLYTGFTEESRKEGIVKTGDIWRFAATNAILYFSASTLGAFLCDPLTEVVTGRRGALFVAGFFTFAASVGAAYSNSWQTLLATRVFLGIGMGSKTSVVPVYESEVSPARLRGRYLVSWQTGTALGIALSAVMPLVAPESWRFQVSSTLIPSAALLCLVYVGSESPRWLIKKERYAEAYQVLLRLRGHDLLAARDLINIRSQLLVETVLFMPTGDSFDLGNEIPRLDAKRYREQISILGYGRRIKQLFTIPRVRRSTIAASVVMSAQQMSGINVFTFLAATLFSYAPDSGSEFISETNSRWLYFGFGMANFIFSAIGYFYIDTKGRRFLLIASLAGMIPLLLATALSFLADEPKVRLGLVSTFLILFTIAYSPGCGVVPFLYTSEVFPSVLREVGMAWGSAVTFFGAGILLLVVPQLIRLINPLGVLGLFTGFDAIALVLVWLLAPGTERQGITVEEMNYVFGVSTARHVSYQLHVVAPWFYRRYILRRDVEVPPSLYRYAQWEHVTEDA